MRIYFLLFALTAILYVDRAALPLAAAAVAREFDLSPVAMGYLLSSFGWLYFLALIPIGGLVGRLGAYRVGGVGIGLLSVASASLALAWSFGSILVGRMAAGLCAAVTYPTGTRTIRDHVGDTRWGFATGVLHSGSLFGPAIGAVALTWMIHAFSWRMAFVATGLIGFIWLALWVGWHRQHGVQGVPPRQPPDADPSRARPSRPAGLLSVVRSPNLRAIAVAHGGAGFSTQLFVAWLPGYLQMEQSLSITETGLLLGGAYLCAGMIVLLVLKLSDACMPADLTRGTRRFWVAAALFAAGIVASVPLLDHLYAIVLVITLSLAACASAVSLNLTLINDLTTDARDVGLAVGFVSAIGNVFGLLSPIVTGYIVAATGRFHLAFALCGGLLAAAAILLLALSAPGPRADTAASFDAP
ncbi:MFS transporter [Cupriavidus plantarum]|uniref:MFS transporter n=1 Tax=Cupriavidus plantarum TaxID=942865 RepID=UPI000EB10D6E|nr:MFS transporter [Cupriavidus plantarum]RLK31637.1 ACS family glucarate transporter-like MFS transporter [Cupriavidus plantarum]